jgi:outer membrane immunogenic protein
MAKNFQYLMGRVLRFYHCARISSEFRSFLEDSPLLGNTSHSSNPGDRNMQKLFRAAAITTFLVGIGAAANAADLPVAPAPAYKAPAIVAPMFSWTGFYLGGNLGAGWQNGTLTDSFGLFNFNANNNATFVGGGQVGANYQFGGGFVVGIEGDFDWFANDNNSVTVVTPAGTTLTGSNNGRWLTTLTGRLGYAWDRVLFYGKGGGAWVGSNNLTLTDAAGTSVSFSNNNTNTGWTAGAGVEWAFTNNWTARVEYDYVGLSNESFTVPAGFPPATVGDVISTNNRNIQMVTVGVNYLFNWGTY